MPAPTTRSTAWSSWDQSSAACGLLPAIRDHRARMRTCSTPIRTQSATAASAAGPPANRIRSSAMPSSGPAARAGAATTRTNNTTRTGRMCPVQTHRRRSELRCNGRMATTDVSEREARQVAEAAREQEWKLPSFGKELFLGNFRLDLIHPQPRLSAEAVEKGERFVGRLRAFLTEKVDPLVIERDAKIPDEVVDGLKALGALGMKVPEQYGGLGLSQIY